MSSGPLARSAHMRMKMKKRNDANVQSDVTSYRSKTERASPKTRTDHGSHSYFTSASSPVSSRDRYNAPHSAARSHSPAGAVRPLPGYGARSPRRAYGGINSLHTSDDLVVDTSTTLDGVGIPPSRKNRANKPRRRSADCSSHEYDKQHRMYDDEESDKSKSRLDSGNTTVNYNDHVETPQGTHSHHLSPRQQRLASRPRRSPDSSPTWRSDVLATLPKDRISKHGSSRGPIKDDTSKQSMPPIKNDQNQGLFDPFSDPTSASNAPNGSDAPPRRLEYDEIYQGERTDNQRYPNAQKEKELDSRVHLSVYPPSTSPLYPLPPTPSYDPLHRAAAKLPSNLVATQIKSILRQSPNFHSQQQLSDRHQNQNSQVTHRTTAINHTRTSHRHLDHHTNRPHPPGNRFRDDYEKSTDNHLQERDPDEPAEIGQHFNGNIRYERVAREEQNLNSNGRGFVFENNKFHFDKDANPDEAHPISDPEILNENTHHGLVARLDTSAQYDPRPGQTGNTNSTRGYGEISSDEFFPPVMEDEENVNDLDYEYHIENDEGTFEEEEAHGVHKNARGDDIEESQTVNSDIALYGTPVRKKGSRRSTHRSKKEHESRFIIHNLGNEDSLQELRARSDPRSSIDHAGSQDDGEDEEIQKCIQSDQKHYENSDHLRSYGGDETNSEPDKNWDEFQDNVPSSTNPFVFHGRAVNFDPPSLGDDHYNHAALPRNAHFYPDNQLKHTNHAQTSQLTIHGRIDKDRPHAINEFQQDSFQPYKHNYESNTSFNPKWDATNSPGRSTYSANSAPNQQTTNPFDFPSASSEETGDDAGDKARKVIMPRRIGSSKSWDSNTSSGKQIGASKSWDVPSVSNEDFVYAKQGNIWNNKTSSFDENPDHRDQPHPKHRRTVTVASKSRDNDNQTWQESKEGWTKDSARNQFQANKHENELFQGDESANANALAEWEKAEVEWQKKTDDDSLSNKPLYLKGRHHPWKSDRDISVPMQLDTSIRDEEMSEYDDDSIFAFERVDTGPPPPIETDPADIFQKITSGLKQADQKKNRVLRKEPEEELGHTDDKKQQENIADEIAAPQYIPDKVGNNDTNKRNSDTRLVAFAGEGENTIHTYLVPGTTSETSESQNYRSDGDSSAHCSASNDGEIAKDPQQTFSSEQYLSEPERQNLEAEQFEDSFFRGKKDSDHQQAINGMNDGELLNNNIDPLKHRDDDCASRESNTSTVGESTAAESAKSARSTASTTASDEQNMTFLEHMDVAVSFVASSIGDLFRVPRSDHSLVRSHEQINEGSMTEDDKSMQTDRDDDTNAQSTFISRGEDWTQRTEETEKGPGWLNYVENVLFPAEMEENNDQSTINDSSAHLRRWSDGEDDEEEEDSYLLQQAVAAARAVHDIHGVEFDEMQDINVLTDIKFLVVTVCLPLGLLFQEHEVGVWVSKVIPNGNGARNGVQVGDQLAAINGTNTVHALIDEVASAISSTPPNASVELTFLRYIGPLRPVPGAVIQEGFEVTDNSVSKKPPPSKYGPNNLKSVVKRLSAPKKEKSFDSVEKRLSVPKEEKSFDSVERRLSTPKRDKLPGPANIGNTKLEQPQRVPKEEEPLQIATQNETGRVAKNESVATLSDKLSRENGDKTTNVSDHEGIESRPGLSVAHQKNTKVSKKKSTLGKFLPFKKKK